MANGNNRGRIASKVPPLNILERRFSFIKNDALRANIALAFQHIIFLIVVIEQEQAEGTTIGSSAHKSMIIYTATIVEGCLHYCVQEYVEAGKVRSSDIAKVDWVPENQKKLYEISDGEYVCGAVMKKKTEPYNEKLHFQELNRLCKRIGILTEPLFEVVEDIREKRNKLHLAGLGEFDSVYSKKDVQSVFENARAITDRVETLIQKL
jgi:hypothetical protein